MIKKSIPSLITCLNLICGLLAILSDDLRIGVGLIVLGGIFDVFDGFVARMLGVTTEIGAQLDSLADVVSFGVAPAILFYRAFEGDGSLISLLGPIFIVSAGALRLARFNTTESSSSYFEGLAIPATGLFFCGLVISKYYGDSISEIISKSFYITTSIAALMAVLNVSKIKMFSLKQLSSSNLVKSYFTILVLTAVFLFIYLPYSSLAIIILAYVVFALIDHFILKSETKLVAQSK